MSFSSEQLEIAKQLRAGFRSSGTFRAQPTPQLRSSNGLVRPLPSNAPQSKPTAQPSGHSVVTRSVAARIAAQQKPPQQPQQQQNNTPKKAASVSSPATGSTRLAYPVHQKSKLSPVDSNIAKGKAKASASAPAADNWGPVVTYYGEEPASKPTPSAQTSLGSTSTAGRPGPVKPIQTDFVATKSVQASFPPKSVSSKESQTHGDYHEDLIDFRSPTASNSVKPAPVDLLSDVFSTLTPPSENKGNVVDPLKPTGTLKHSAPAHTPDGLREALELSKAGKPFVWNYSEGPPQIREVQPVMEEPPKTPKDECFKPWLRPQQMRVPWLEPSAESPMDLDSPVAAPSPPRAAPCNTGLKGSRHND